MDRVLVHDISHWQGDLSNYWIPFINNGCKAVIAKATEGYAYYSIFKDHIKQAREHGLLVGSYHYFRQQITSTSGGLINCDPKKQAKNYYDWVSSMGMLDLPPALDIEKANNPYLSVSTLTTCLQEIERLFGRKPLIYSNPEVLNNVLKNPDWGNYPLWLAHYNPTPSVPKPWKTWTLWQFSDKLTYSPIGGTAKKPIDHNWFNGSYEDLIKFCGIDGTIPSPPEPPVLTPWVRIKPNISYVRFRREPALYAGYTLIVGGGTEMKYLDDVTTDITYYQVEFDGYIGFVTAGKAYTEIVMR